MYRLNLGESSKMVIFVSLLTTINVINGFWVTWSLPKIGSNLKPNHHDQVKLVQNPDIHTRMRQRSQNTHLQVSEKMERKVGTKRRFCL